MYEGVPASPAADSEVLIRQCETEVGDERPYPEPSIRILAGLMSPVDQAVSMSVMKGLRRQSPSSAADS